MTGTVYRSLEEGLSCHEHGRLEDAARFYGDVLERDPTSSDAWHLMGRVWLGKREFGAAAACVLKAIQLRPDLPAFHATLGDILMAQGRGREAALCYEEAVRRDPRFLPALVNLGNLMQDQGRFQEAVVLYVRALEADPTSAEAFNNLGNALRAMGRNEEAIDCYREVRRLRPDMAEAPVNLAVACLRQGREREAEQWARLALELRPGLPEALSNLAIALLNQQRFAEAEPLARQALAQEPLAAHLHANLGSVLVHQKRWREAEYECGRALELRPGQHEAMNNLGVIFQFTGRLEEAAAQFRKALEDQPGDADAWTNLGAVRAAQARHDDALSGFEEALRNNPRHAKAHFCHSLELLGRGRWEEGFAEYEWRFKVMHPPRGNAGPAWDGGPLEGRTILLSAEQGLGDTIQFARYIPLVAARGGRVIVECQPAAIPIVRSVVGVAEAFAEEDPLPDFAVQASMASLPRIFGSTMENIPNRTPYICCARELTARMAERLGPRRGLRAGLAWAGNPENGGDRRRSMPLAALAPLSSVTGVEWFSLHIGAKARETVRECGGWMREVLSEDGGLAELAALVSCLDLVITVDTMPAHLAGALARPVWILLCAAADWRWTREAERSPWYPTARLFRQTVPGEWDAVVERVIHALSNFPVQPSAGAPDT